VIAMQFEISDAAAKTFAREFYCAIAEGHPVDAAVCESRKALFNEEFGQEWATPVLYMRSHEGTLFELAPAGAGGSAATATPTAAPGSGEHIVVDAARKAAELAEASRAAEAAATAERERAEKERAELARIESAKADAERRRIDAEKAAAAAREREERETERAAVITRDLIRIAEPAGPKTSFPAWQIGAGVVIFALLFALSWHHLRPHSHADEEGGAGAPNSPQAAPVAPAPSRIGNSTSSTQDESTAGVKHGDNEHAKKSRDIEQVNDSKQRSDASATKPASVASNSASNASAPTRIRVSATDQEAKLISRVTPVYPPLAVQARIAGTVLLEVVIAKNGKVESVAVVSGHPLLLESAMDAVKQRVYQPTLVNGRAVEVDTRVTVIYSLNR
jgi:TonB family protein